MTDEATPPLVEISVEAAGIDADLVADAFRQACTAGVAIETPSRLDRATETYIADGEAPALVKGYVPATEDAERIRQSLQLALSGAPLDRPLTWRKNTALEATDWRDSWKKYFGVQRIGQALVIVPSWVDYTKMEGETVIRIDPGMAFGTGQHPTTAMCLAGLEALGPREADVLDLGCGSGILAIAAALLGARRVLALDIDSQAIKATNENAAANGVADVIVAGAGTLEAGSGQDAEFDLVLANISGLTLDRLSPEIRRALKPGGRLVASGFLDDTVEGLQRVFEAAGLAVERVAEEGVWRAITARRRE